MGQAGLFPPKSGPHLTGPNEGAGLGWGQCLGPAQSSQHPGKTTVMGRASLKVWSRAWLATCALGSWEGCKQAPGT